ncbi:hypothetical protein [Elizabethkingia miricola]|uniref:hypothetical protein n=1 Tax=Elizabethkingia miricola TaxID=172045 RepID=UPI00140CF77C|nr:hypothetical protein [Elizabethkingia miricola]NHQ65266.1 hypothetical protein [Elizabethkingia miricola]NHQ72615.1 hypothetical protein [Elizabethkingia miricola]NHQ79680.1 hypothetical protein [Elizabethkingia miricola]UIO97456.1 hypothetical protein LYZ41_05055 [Elizabethkingia miricola]WER14239.1 hypothetical protein P0M31_05065 [Elizabethkingia miricola]
MLICGEITIGKLKFTAGTGIEIRKSWRTFTNTAKVALPKALYYKDETGQVLPVKHIGDFIKRGDKVEIKLGYNQQLFTEFTGYVAYSPHVAIPYEIECEDEMFILKQKRVSVSLQNATIKEIVQAAAPGYELDCIDELYGNFSMNETTPVKIFNKIKEDTGISIFFRDNRLVCGKVYMDEKQDKKFAVYEYGNNIITDTLQYVKDEDVKLKIFAISRHRNGTVIRTEIGEDGGNVEHWEMPRDLTESQLKEHLKKRYDRNKRHFGFTGTITSFGWPRVEHGQVIHLKDKIYEERNGKYFVNNVEIFVSAYGGYRRTVEIGREYIENALPLN